MAFDLPTNAGTDRDQAILNHIRKGDFEIRWAKITNTYEDHTAEFAVFADALKIDGVRVNMTAECQQQVADLLGCLLLTPKLADLLFFQRNVTLVPMPMPITSSTAAMVEQSKKIDTALVALSNPPGIIQTLGKHWVIDNDLLHHPGKSENYGWHFVGNQFGGKSWEGCVSGGCRLIQGRGWAHDIRHVDYSQNCVLVARACIVDGHPMDLVDVLKKPELAGLASHQGVMTVFRQPGVTELLAVSNSPGSKFVPVSFDPSTGEDKEVSTSGTATGVVGVALLIGSFWLAWKAFKNRR